MRKGLKEMVIQGDGVSQRSTELLADERPYYP